jgi:hypothetical protein
MIHAVRHPKIVAAPHISGLLLGISFPLLLLWIQNCPSQIPLQGSPGCPGAGSGGGQTIPCWQTLWFWAPGMQWLSQGGKAQLLRPLTEQLYGVNLLQVAQGFFRIAFVYLTSPSDQYFFPSFPFTDVNFE